MDFLQKKAFHPGSYCGVVWCVVWCGGDGMVWCVVLWCGMLWCCGAVGYGGPVVLWCGVGVAVVCWCESCVVWVEGGIRSGILCLFSPHLCVYVCVCLSGMCVFECACMFMCVVR